MEVEQQLTEALHISEARYFSIGKELQDVTVGKLYRLHYGNAVAFDLEKSFHQEYYFINDSGNKMTLMCVWNFYESKFYK